MRLICGRCGMLAIADLTWLSLKTLHEQTIIPASLPINRALILQRR